MAGFLRRNGRDETFCVCACALECHTLEEFSTFPEARFFSFSFLSFFALFVCEGRLACAGHNASRTARLGWAAGHT